MGLEVSPMCDRDTISLCNMQMGFIEFVVAPLIIGELGLLRVTVGVFVTCFVLFGAASRCYGFATPAHC
jgi:hypothetical protein